MDLKTVFIINLVMFFIATGALTLLWLQYRKRFHGLSHWAITFLLSSFSSVLIGLRGGIPDFLSIIAGNLLLFIGLTLLLSGFELFFGLPSHKRLNTVFAVLATVFQAVFTYIKPDLHMRENIFNLFCLLIYVQILWLMRKRLPQKSRPMSVPLQIVFALLIAATLYRAIAIPLFPVLSQDYFQNDFHEIIFLVFSLAQWTVFTFSIMSMVSRRLLAEVLAEESKFNIIFEDAPYAMALSRLDNAVIADVNASFVELSGYGHDEIIGKKAQDLGFWADPSARDQMMESLEKGEPVKSNELMFRQKNGGLLPVLYSAAVVRIDSEDYILSSLKNISEIVDLRGKLEIMATHDALTRLPNRVLFADRFAVAHAQAVRNKAKFAVAIFDLDDFKNVNDTLGHNIGDLLLIAVAERISRFIRLSDTVARFGGDEFVILLNNIQSKSAAEETLSRILDIYRQPFEINNLSLNAKVSIGAAIYPDDADNETDLLRKADEALYRIKRNGKNGLKFFS